MNRIAIVTAALAAIATAPAAARAEVPDLVPVQGVLSDGDGLLVTGDHDIVFSLYESDAGGTPLWSEPRVGVHSVTVDEGYFLVYLGEVALLEFESLLDYDELWLGITVDSDSEMTRVRFGSVPFAFEALVCSQVGSLAEGDIQPILTGAASCGEGYYLRGWDDVAGSPICDADQGGTVTITAGSGLTMDGTEISVDTGGIGTSHLASGAVTKDKLDMNDFLLVYQNNQYCELPGSVTTSATCQTRVCQDDEQTYYYTCTGSCWFNYSPSTCSNDVLGYIVEP